MLVIRVTLKIYGDVQGVFFRRSAKLEADRLDIVGWIRNDKDGSVEVMAQGEKDKVDQFIKWCKKGPPFSKVKKVEVVNQNGLENFDEFSII